MMLVRLRGVMLVVAVLVAMTLAAAQALAASPTAKKQRGKVWVVYFSSEECPFCKGVTRLIQELSKKYPIKLKKFSVDKPNDHALLDRIESIHAKGRLEVPVVILDETILMGEEEITAKLEPIVRRLAASGGAAPPYLGPVDDRDQPLGEKARRECSTCERRPPTIGEEWAKIRGLLDRLF
ncbi:MAG: hypothetical protein LDL33_05420 [Desulfomonile sp.]|nr:hypothetical protein [Desulfomonile sp.]